MVNLPERAVRVTTSNFKSSACTNPAQVSYLYATLESSFSLYKLLGEKNTNQSHVMLTLKNIRITTKNFNTI